MNAKTKNRNRVFGKIDRAGSFTIGASDRDMSIYREFEDEGLVRITDCAFIRGSLVCEGISFLVEKAY